jgi:hypothetical protein
MTETKSCTKCLEIKEHSEFYLQRGKPRGMCKECSKKQNSKNPNKKVNNKKYNDSHKEEQSRRMKEYYKNKKLKELK